MSATSSLAGLRSSGDSSKLSVDAPASSRIRTVAAQSGSGLVCGRSPLPTLAPSSGVLSPGMSRASISAAGVEGEAKVEHQAYRLGVAALGGEFDRAAFVLGQPVHQSWILRDQL